VGSAKSGCRGVLQYWGEGLVGERAAAYATIGVSSRRFEIHVYDPERTELDVSGVEDEALPDSRSALGTAVNPSYPRPRAHRITRWRANPARSARSATVPRPALG